MNILCIIPARSGSKGIKHKNIKLFRGKPLLVWSIIQAKQCKYNMKILVSTDSEEYLNIAKKAGAEVPFLRPKELSEDLSTDYEYVKYTLDKLKEKEEYIPDIIVQLRPTYPTRKVEDLDHCIEIFLKERENGYTSLRTIVPFEKSPYKMYMMKGNNLEPLFKDINGVLEEPYNRCRQELPQTFLHNGCIDIMNANIINEGTISGNKIYGYIMNKEEIKDIDYEKDWVE